MMIAMHEDIKTQGISGQKYRGVADEIVEGVPANQEKRRQSERSAM